MGHVACYGVRSCVEFAESARCVRAEGDFEASGGGCSAPVAGSFLLSAVKVLALPGSSSKLDVSARIPSIFDIKSFESNPAHYQNARKTYPNQSHSFQRPTYHWVARIRIAHASETGRPALG